jgi:hypothetical protein
MFDLNVFKYNTVCIIVCLILLSTLHLEIFLSFMQVFCSISCLMYKLDLGSHGPAELVSEV